MLVILDVVAVMVMVVMVVMVVMAALHALAPLLRQRRYLGHQRQRDGDILAGSGKDVLHPALALAAIIEEYVRPGQGDHVQRRGFKAVGLLPRGYQQRCIHIIAADLADKIIIGEYRAYHLQLSVLRRRLPCGAADEGECQQQHQCKWEKALHFSASRPQFSHRP